MTGLINKAKWLPNTWTKFLCNLFYKQYNVLHQFTFWEFETPYCWYRITINICRWMRMFSGAYFLWELPTNKLYITSINKVNILLQLLLHIIHNCVLWTGETLTMSLPAFTTGTKKHSVPTLLPSSLLPFQN